jgi:hypothetical protein
MYGLTIGQDNHAKKPVLHFRHLHPTPDAAVSLDRFPNWRPDGLLDPFISDDSPIWPLTDCREVACNLYVVSVSDFLFPGSGVISIDSACCKRKVRKHHASFEDTARAFLDPNRIETFDRRDAYGEDRWKTVGLV